MLGLELDKQAKASDGKTTLRSIVEYDIGKQGHSVVAMVAPSESGKTATVIDLFEDLNFAQLAIDVEDMLATIVRTSGVAFNLLDIESEATRLARQRVELELLARFLFLEFLFRKNPDPEPQQFFREQTATTATSTIREPVKVLRMYDGLANQYMLYDVQTKLHSHLEPRRRSLVIALDEAQAAATSILADKFISSSALAAYWITRNPPSALFDAKGEIHRHHRRGFLAPLSATLNRMQATLNRMQATLVILGTALSLLDADHVYAAVGKDINFTRITNFPQFDKDNVYKILLDLVDFSGCEIPPAKRHKLSGRARLSLGIINHLFATGSIEDSKQEILENAIDKRIESVKFDLRHRVRSILVSDQTGEACRPLCRMVLAYQLQNVTMSFSNSQQADFVEMALCRLRPHPHSVHLIMNEPLVIEAVEEELKALNKDPSYIENLDHLHRIVANLGSSSESKGSVLQMLVRRSLQCFNGTRLVDLTFLQDVVLPNWCDNLQLQIDDINTASGFGYKGSVTAADLAFLAHCPSSVEM
ncbi:hypothetical protein BGZ96_001905 [Linnemannia gamsii]|uniref:Uncharacterized protein n=1 Tax=Linnemannia gamsii TaxID=64522 RepID=A0ABQ7JLS0_9FUNG|nr:hypothetical protein BGZ96_001905 [Linnemannia gamsii]